MAIVGMMMVWNSAQFVAAPIMAVHKFVDKIVVCDGAYKQMRDIGYSKMPYSTDATKQIVQALMKKVACEIVWIDCKNYWLSQVHKKNHMLKHIELGDWHYHMCDDELLYGDLARGFKHVRNEKKGGIGHLNVMEPHFKKASFILWPRRWKMRFIRWGKGYQWRKYHYILNTPQSPDARKLKKAFFNITEMAILHLKYGRPLHRIKAQNLYESTPH